MTLPSKIESFSGEWRFLSNFYPCLITHEGLRFASVEHAYQAAKFLAPEVRYKFLEPMRAGEAKRLGRRVKLREDWEEVKLSIMLDLLRLKFSPPFMQASLLSTGEAELIEGNSWGDHYWGVCMGMGENHLGRLLMQVRAELREKS